MALAIALVSRWVCAAMACARMHFCIYCKEENGSEEDRQLGFCISKEQTEIADQPGEERYASIGELKEGMGDCTITDLGL